MTLAQPQGMHAIETCPSCAADGGYGHAVPGVWYRCPECRCRWMPDPNGKVATSQLGNWWQRVKVWWTS